MRILLTGKGGQVGAELDRRLRQLGEVVALDRSALDLADPGAIRETASRARPAIIVNSASYTAVDRAESDRAAAFAVNASAAGILAEEAKKLGALLVHFSTDYVFDGEKATPYTEEDPPRPLNAYGESKLAGDRAIAESGCRHLIFRTSWVYSPRGRNFMLAILAAAKAGRELRVVDDQRGAPTAAHFVAGAVAQVLADPGIAGKPSGVYNLSAAGETTWHGFARELLARSGLNPPIAAVTSAQYGAVAARPRNSLLDHAKLRRTFGLSPPDWREGAAQALAAIQ